MTTIGQILRRERLKRKLSIDDVEKETKIKANFIEALEQGEYEKLPSSAYAQGFVISYAQFLKVPKNQALALFKREFDEGKSIGVLPKGLTSQNEFAIRKRRLTLPFTGAVLAAIIILTYLFFQYRSALINPSLNVSNPKENEVISGQNIQVIGSTDSNSTVMVDNSQVAVSGNGTFTTSIPLFPGNVVIHITATNRFGRQTSVDRHIIVK